MSDPRHETPVCARMSSEALLRGALADLAFAAHLAKAVTNLIPASAYCSFNVGRRQQRHIGVEARLLRAGLGLCPGCAQGDEEAAPSALFIGLPKHHATCHITWEKRQYYLLNFGSFLRESRSSYTLHKPGKVAFMNAVSQMFTVATDTHNQRAALSVSSPHKVT